MIFSTNSLIKLMFDDYIIIYVTMLLTFYFLALWVGPSWFSYFPAD